MSDELPIEAWRRSVRELDKRGLKPEQIAAVLRCDVELVRIQLKIWAEQERGDK